MSTGHLHHAAAPPLQMEGAPAILTVGRVNLDLYVAEPGVAIADARSYIASVGGSPANIAIVASRLGVPSAVLSATGTDHSGEFVRDELERHGVDTRWLGETSLGATSLALLATLAPDQGQRQFYRDNPADAHVDVTALDHLPWGSLKAVVVSADSLAKGAMALAASTVARRAADEGIDVWWDLDLRPSSWAERRYHQVVPRAIDGSSTIIGTEEEFASFFGFEEYEEDDFQGRVRQLGLSTVVLKRGPRGASLFREGDHVLDVPAASSKPVCTVGAGDTVAGALVSARLAGQEWSEALAFAMKAAAWTVTQPYCSTGFPRPANLNTMPLTVAGEVAPR